MSHYCIYAWLIFNFYSGQILIFYIYINIIFIFITSYYFYLYFNFHINFILILILIFIFTVTKILGHIYYDHFNLYILMTIILSHFILGKLPIRLQPNNFFFRLHISSLHTNTDITFLLSHFSSLFSHFSSSSHLPFPSLFSTFLLFSLSHKLYNI